MFNIILVFARKQACADSKLCVVVMLLNRFTSTDFYLTGLEQKPVRKYSY